MVFKSLKSQKKNVYLPKFSSAQKKEQYPDLYSFSEMHNSLWCIMPIPTAS
jgi:hypothetical protein